MEVGCHCFLQGIFSPRDQTWVSLFAGRFFTIWATMEAPNFPFLGFVSWTQATESGGMLVTLLLWMHRQMVSLESFHVLDQLLTQAVMWKELWPPNLAIHSSTPLTPPRDPHEDLSQVDYISGHQCEQVPGDLLPSAQGHRTSVDTEEEDAGWLRRPPGEHLKPHFMPLSL